MFYEYSIKTKECEESEERGVVCHGAAIVRTPNTSNFEANISKENFQKSANIGSSNSGVSITTTEVPDLGKIV
jgi:hypothetical protein